MNDIISVQVNCPSAAVAKQLARELVEQRLAAASNLVGKIDSVYRWQGEVREREEFTLVARTTRARFDALVERVRAVHPDDTPSVFAVDVAAASPQYAEWVRAQVGP